MFVLSTLNFRISLQRPVSGLLSLLYLFQVFRSFCEWFKLCGCLMRHKEERGRRGDGCGAAGDAGGERRKKSIGGSESAACNSGGAAAAGPACADRQGRKGLLTEGGCFMEDIVLDVEEMEAEQVWGMVRKAVLAALAGCDLEGQPSSTLVLWMPPPCGTFSRADALNRKDSEGRGCGYRGHKHWLRPPLNRHNAKGGWRYPLSASFLLLQKGDKGRRVCGPSVGCLGMRRGRAGVTRVIKMLV